MTNKRQTYLLNLIKKACQYRLVKHDGNFTCDFDGKLLITLNQCPDNVKTTCRVWFVSLQDADDMLYQYWTRHECNAYTVFNKFFLLDDIITWAMVKDFGNYIDEDFVDDISLLRE